MKQLANKVAIAVTAAVALLAGVEGLSTKSYQDTGGVWTLCYGETRGVKQNQTATKQQCWDMLYSSAVEEYDWVAKQLPGLNANQYAALVSFCYNVGRGNCAASTLFKHARSGNYAAAGLQFGKWKYVTKGKVKLDCVIRSNNCYGIIDRRKAEATLWSKPL